MRRHFIDRWADTTVFRFMLLGAALVVLPMLAVGVLATAVGSVLVLIRPSPVDFAEAVFALLSVGGVLGFTGYLRAHLGVQKPECHGITATVVCLAFGVVAALVVAGFALTGVLAAHDFARGGAFAAALVASACSIWAVSGIAWTQRLRSTYLRKTGRVFDSLPALLLLVALGLATAAALLATTL